MCVCPTHSEYFFYSGSIFKCWVTVKRFAFMYLFPTKRSRLKIEKEEETAKSSKQICCEKTAFERNLGWDSIKTCLLCTPPNSAQDYASLENSSFILSLARISVLGKLEMIFLLNLVFLHATTGSRNNHGGPVILQINIFSGSGLPRICFFLALRSGLISLLEMCLFLQSQWSF